MEYADLHLHSTASDGTCPPGEVVRKFAETGFSIISITDHDSVAGIDETVSAGNELGIEVIPGIELSTIYDDKEEIHILGYYIDWQSDKLKKTLDNFLYSRKIRAEKIIKKLNDIGVKIDKDKVFKLAGSEFIGRLHIARAMVKEGYVKNVSEAFTEKYIGRNGRAYVERFKMKPREAIELILELGGIPVLAHPGMYGWGECIDEKIIKEFVDNGLMGIEIFYPCHSELVRNYYLKMTQKFNLLVTGGSDYHGKGTGRDMVGEIKLPIYYVDKMKARINR